MKLPARVYRPLAAGAPAPWRELPVALERMIHFFPPHIAKMRAKVPEMIGNVDVLLGNLEDAIPAEAKAAARAGFIEIARANDFAGTGLWVRINSLNSPWALDDMIEVVAAVGDKLDVIMLPKVEGPQQESTDCGGLHTHQSLGHKFQIASCTSCLGFWSRRVARRCHHRPAPSERSEPVSRHSAQA
jgi:hypothetical protein